MVGSTAVQAITVATLFPRLLMTYPFNPFVRAVRAPPVEEIHAWIQGRSFPPDKELLDVAHAVPRIPPATILREHLARLILEDGAGGYTSVLGLSSLREAFASHLSEAYRGTVVPGQVAVTAGCNQAFCLVMAALTQPGDEVILPLPFYFNHQMWLEMQGVKTVALPFEESTGGIPDPERAATLVNDRTRAIVLVTPNNPTGAIYAPPVIERFYELARENGIALVLDETYKDFRPEQNPPHNLFGREDWPDRLIQLFSFSKAYSLAGYRVGTVTGGILLLEEIAKVADCLSICAPRIGQEAALFGLHNLAGWLEENRKLMIAAKTALVETSLGTQDGYRLISAGGYFAYVQHPFAEKPAVEVARRLADRQNVLCFPGSGFGPDQERYLRIAFGNLQPEQMPGLAQRLDSDAGG